MAPAWSELHCHSVYSYLDGASRPAELARRAAERGYAALALTDHDSLAGLIEHARACRDAGITPIAGCEVTLSDGHHLTLLARDAAGYRSLCRIVSQAQLAGSKGEPRLDLDALAAGTAGLECLTGCRHGAVASALLARDDERALRALERLCDLFGREHVWVEVQHRQEEGTDHLLRGLARLARRIDRPLVATGNAHYVWPRQRPLQDVLACIRQRRPLDQATLRRGAPWHLLSPAEMAARFSTLPEALEGTATLASRCAFDLSHIDATLPDFPVPEGQTAAGYLRALVLGGLAERYGEAAASAEVQGRLTHELEVIGQLRLENYFLIIWDIVREARARGILCQGRGSAVGSLVCYCLGITAIEPLRHHLSFERFLSMHRVDPPDVDIDFPSDRGRGVPAREEVIQYVLARYAGQAALVCTHITFHQASAIRDAGVAFGLDPAQIDLVARLFDHAALGSSGDAPEVWRRILEQNNPTLGRLYTICQELEGVPRHASQHPGGLILSKRPLAEVAPMERARMDKRVVIQWDKDAAEDAGLVKIDILGLGMLAAIDRCFELIARETGRRPELHGFTCDDPRVYRDLQEADTIGLFQLESRAQQTACLPQLQPACFEDIVAAVAIIRPGPILANATHPYLRRRQGLEPVSYPGGERGRALLEPVLGSTLGVCIFQDQVIEIARRCGLRPEEASELRRAMSSNRSPARMAALRGRLLEGLAAHGLERQAQEDVVQVIEAFSGFGFVRGHAASFAYLAYVSCWLRVYHRAAFTAALLETQPLGFYRGEVIVHDAQRHGVRVLPVDLRAGKAEATLEDGALRLGFRQVKGLGDAACRRLEEAVALNPLHDLRAILEAAHLSEREVKALARAGALDGYYAHRRDALLHAPLLAREVGPHPALPGAYASDVHLAEPTPLETFLLDHDALGFSPHSHVMAHLRPRLRRRLPRADDLARLPDGTYVGVAGQFELRQQPATAKGMRFITLSDETGLINLAVPEAIYKRYRRVIRSAGLLWVEGTVEHRYAHEKAVTIRVSRCRPFAQLLAPPRGTEGLS